MNVTVPLRSLLYISLIFTEYYAIFKQVLNFTYKAMAKAAPFHANKQRVYRKGTAGSGKRCTNTFRPRFKRFYMIISSQGNNFSDTYVQFFSQLRFPSLSMVI